MSSPWVSIVLVLGVPWGAVIYRWLKTDGPLKMKEWLLLIAGTLAWIGVIMSLVRR